mmetsp:Transcript_41475/g.54572  ORF Transcript_41475/g.54572 Transcript_41475/m.54572 type:complete len:114 (+) Transcript_41475:542-883(+)
MIFKYSLVLLTIISLSFTTTGSKKERATIKVYGECGMCETRIENAINELEGVAWADWEETTLELTVKYDPEVISLEQIKQKAANVGHDTDDIRASEKAYENLHPCCKYERPKN